MSWAGKGYVVAVTGSTGEIPVRSRARLLDTALESLNSCPPFHYLTALPFIPQHIIYTDSRLTVGLSRRPTTLGHTLVVLRQSDLDLFSIKLKDFIGVMLRIAKVAPVICKVYNVGRCALVIEGGNSLSILPLHGLSKEWQPVISDLKEFHKTFLGYISSKDGPHMDAGRLDDIFSTIQKVSDLLQPFQYFFVGDQSNKNLFAWIVRR